MTRLHVERAAAVGVHVVEGLAQRQLARRVVRLERALQHTHGHKQDAAKRLGWGRNTLTRKLKELGVN